MLLKRPDRVDRSDLMQPPRRQILTMFETIQERKKFFLSIWLAMRRRIADEIECEKLSQFSLKKDVGESRWRKERPIELVITVGRDVYKLCYCTPGRSFLING